MVAIYFEISTFTSPIPASFTVEGTEDAQITLGLEEDTEYDVKINGEDAGRMRTNLGGKLNVSVELAGIGEVKVEISK